MASNAAPTDSIGSLCRKVKDNEIHYSEKKKRKKKKGSVPYETRRSRRLVDSARGAQVAKRYARFVLARGKHGTVALLKLHGVRESVASGHVWIPG